MSRVDVAEIVALQRNTANIRNICVLAHIDHGKTTLTDSLICSNGIISPKLAGKLRFLDSTEDEQQRGITMHASAISLLFRSNQNSTSTSIPLNTNEERSNSSSSSSDYLINLIDSPGHIDFSSDVSTATRLCDGALIVIDVLEGICTQTHAVVYKALREGLVPVLVLNKIDRLCLELQLTSSEAHAHLRRILENVNALTYTLLNSETMSAAAAAPSSSSVPPEEHQPLRSTSEAAVELEEVWNFSPSKGNVIFASAFDTWGFSLTRFANLWAKKSGLNRNALQKYLWEDYSFNESTKKIVKYDASDSSVKPMFAAMVLEPLWKLYHQCITSNDLAGGVAWFSEEFDVKLPPREINTRDARGTVRALLRTLLPLSEAVLRMVVKTIPSPAVAQQGRIRRLLHDPSQALRDLHKTPISNRPSNSLWGKVEAVVADLESCRAGDAEVIVFVSKMVPVRVSELRAADVAILNRELRSKDASAIDLDPVSGEVMMAMGRVFSGVLRRESKLMVLSPRHDPLGDLLRRQSSELSSIDAEKLDNILPSISSPDFLSLPCTPLPAEALGIYLCFGPSVMPVDEVPAGNIVGIVGIADHVLKTGALSSTWLSPTMEAMTFQAKPIVRVAVEPLNYFDLHKLEAGLKLLYQYDPAVDIGVDTTSGQHTMACLGEIHQEQCIKYLVDKFAKCQVKVSEPIVPFREAVLTAPAGFKPHLSPPWREQVQENQCPSASRFWLETSSISLLFRCAPLSEACLEYMTAHPSAKARLLQVSSFHDNTIKDETATKSKEDDLASVLALLRECLAPEKNSQKGSSKITSHPVIAITPENVDYTDVLLLGLYFTVGLWKENKLLPSTKGPSTLQSSDSPDILLDSQKPLHVTFINQILTRLSSSISAGFQLCCASGPLMAEPLHGVCFVLEKMHITSQALCLSPEDFLKLTSTCMDGVECVFTNLLEDVAIGLDIQTGQLISEVRDGLKACYLSSPMRILEPMYECTLQCDQGQLGNLYSVLSKRRGTVVKDDIIEGTSLFVLTVSIPITESFGLSQELLKRTSGSATTPLLVFSHWQLIDFDPFWRPTTEDELEEFGDNASLTNPTRMLIDKVRRRKGLPVEEKIIEFAEKQRTLNKKK